MCGLSRPALAKFTLPEKESWKIAVIIDVAVREPNLHLSEKESWEIASDIDVTSGKLNPQLPAK